MTPLIELYIVSQCSDQHHVTFIWQLWKAGLLCKNGGKETAV